MRKLILGIAALVTLLSSCQEKDPDEPIYYDEYFPNTVGIDWNYERYDSLYNKLDTVTVNITGDTLFFGNTYKIWEYAYSDETDTLFVRQNFDSVFFFDPSAAMIIQMYYIPFELGQGWHNPEYYNDSSHVTGIEDVTIDEITYHDVFLIDRDVSGPNYYFWGKTWFMPNLGLVQLDRVEFNTAPAKNERWRLIETHLFTGH